MPFPGMMGMGPPGGMPMANPGMMGLALSGGAGAPPPANAPGAGGPDLDSLLKHRSARDRQKTEK